MYIERERENLSSAFANLGIQIIATQTVISVLYKAGVLGGCVFLGNRIRRGMRLPRKSHPWGDALS